MRSRKPGMMAKCSSIGLEVDGEILAVAIPRRIIRKYKTPHDFMESDECDAIQLAAAALGCDEIHLNALDAEYPCRGELTLRGHEDGAGWFISRWGEYHE